MKALNKILYSVFAISTAILGSCTQDSPITNPPKTETDSPVIERGTFAKGADVSWITEMESQGEKFYDANGKEKECMQLLRDECGINSIRLRVWVNPSEGWNNIDDVVLKARRATKLGMRVMIDFHFSDSWADPSNQETPAAWADYDLDELKQAVANHVTEMLTKLKKWNIEPEWVQIGNETRGGMLYPLGSYQNGQNYADLVNAGYDATKSIFPETKVIIHLDSGTKLDIYTRIFGYLATYKGKYDMIGMSLYPSAESWETDTQKIIENINTVSETYKVPVMICEIGMDYQEAEVCKSILTKLVAEGAKTNSALKGIFYWEPETPAGYNGGYSKGCFKDGKPTIALDPFKN